jgi:hypothetical protein
MKRKMFAAAAILGLIVLAGLSFQLSQSAGTHSPQNSLQTSKGLADGKLHSEEAMDPNMPGMNHSNPQVNETEEDRPLKATLGTFGVATSIVLSGALILRQRDDKERKSKIEARKVRGETQ